MALTGKHILSCDMFDMPALEQLFRLADMLRPVANGKKVCRVLQGAVLGSLFFEPSTRTRLSFDAAFLKLGGAVSNTSGTAMTSLSKGETLADTSRVLSGYFDALVVRHPDESAVHEIANATHVPVLNAGNGSGEHPSQALLDLYTLRHEFTRLGKAIDGSRIAMVGDLRYGRTVHSLLRLLALYKRLEIVCIAPPGLPMPQYLLDRAAEHGHRIEVCHAPAQGLRGADLLYATRIQKERFASADAAFDYSAEFRIDSALVNRVCKPDVVIMHPLPRDSSPGANDLSTDLDQDLRLAIFRQAHAGIPIRMALFASILGVASQVPAALREANWYRPAFLGPQDEALGQIP